MRQLKLSTWFRRRLLAVVALVSVTIAAATPVAYGVAKRHELLVEAGLQAKGVAAVVSTAVQERPRLWKYDTGKLSERLAAEGLSHLEALKVRDARGAAVPMEPSGARDAPAAFAWAHEEVWVGGRPVATVWVGRSVATLWRTLGLLTLIFSLVAGVSGALLYVLPMRALVQAEHRIQELVGRLGLALQEDERHRIARDLHDGVGQALTAARLQVLAVQRGASSPEALGRIGHHLDEALEEVRHSTAALLPPSLSELGLQGALERHCDAFGSSVGLQVACVVQALPPLPAHLELACFRVVQEALHNAIRHGHSTQATVRLGVTAGLLELRVEDNGSGLGPDAAPGHGLHSIQERVRLLGGQLTWSGLAGTQLHVAIPLSGGPS